MASGEEGNPPSDPTASAGTSGSAPIVDDARGRPPTAATASVSTWGASRLEARHAITPWKSAATGTTVAAAQTWARLLQVPGTGEAVRAHARKSEGQEDRERLAKLGQGVQRMTAHQKKHLPGIRMAGGRPVSKRLDEHIVPATALSPPGGPLLPEGWAVQYDHTVEVCRNWNNRGSRAGRVPEYRRFRP